jgi:hypothetical protein
MIWRFFRTILLAIPVLLIIASIILFGLPVYRQLVSYPSFDKALKKFQSQRKEVPSETKLHLYKGAMHVHSYWSHDSKGTLQEIRDAAEKNGLDFVMLTDHPHGYDDTIPRGIHGSFNKLLIIPGSEKQGFDLWPAGKAIINWKTDRDSVARDVINKGGIVCLAHTEEDHNWGSKWYQGMEIYNFHTDTKDEIILSQVANFLVNGHKYPQLSFRQMFDEQTAILARWDSLNTIRKITGFAAEDTHENQNLRARYAPDGKLEWYGPNAKLLGKTSVSFWNKWLLNEPDQSGWVLKWMIDTYTEGFNYVTNYLYSENLTTAGLYNGIRKGHLYVAFKSLGDASGFNFTCQDQNNNICGMMGDSVRFENIRSMKAESPLPCQFRLIRNGKIINFSESGSYTYNWEAMIERGAYRIEAHILIDGLDLPWIYSNPVYIY